VEEKPNNNFPIYLNICYITQNIQIFLQWVFVSEMPCNPQTYGVWARKGESVLLKGLNARRHFIRIEANPKLDVC